MRRDSVSMEIEILNLGQFNVKVGDIIMCKYLECVMKVSP